jgi:hypothetical protein
VHPAIATITPTTVGLFRAKSSFRDLVRAEIMQTSSMTVATFERIPFSEKSLATPTSFASVPTRVFPTRRSVVSRIGAAPVSCCRAKVY